MDGSVLRRSDSDQVSNTALDILECCRAVPVGSLRTGCRIRDIEMPVDAVVASARRWQSLSGLVEGWWVSCHSGDGEGWTVADPSLDSKLVSGLGRAADALDRSGSSCSLSRESLSDMGLDDARIWSGLAPVSNCACLEDSLWCQAALGLVGSWAVDRIGGPSELLSRGVGPCGEARFEGALSDTDVCRLALQARRRASDIDALDCELATQDLLDARGSHDPRGDVEDVLERLMETAGKSVGWLVSGGMRLELAGRGRESDQRRVTRCCAAALLADCDAAAAQRDRSAPGRIQRPALGIDRKIDMIRRHNR